MWENIGGTGGQWKGEKTGIGILNKKKIVLKINLKKKRKNTFKPKIWYEGGN